MYYTTSFQILQFLLLALLLVHPTANAATVQLAECPESPNVIGIYINNGKKCVRERQQLERDIVNATCPTGYELQARRKTYCKQLPQSTSDTSTTTTTTTTTTKMPNPICPIDYQRYGSSCHSPCPQGYNDKRGLCIQLRDVLPQHSMTCPTQLHRVGPYCCEPDQCMDLHKEQEQLRLDSHIGGSSSTNTAVTKSNKSWVECRIEEIPGTFYHNPDTSRCERTMTSLPRVWMKLPRDNRNQVMGGCNSEQDKVLGGCQDKCPDGYKAKKGMCQLKPCSIPTDASIVLCPEGRYQIRAMSL